MKKVWKILDTKPHPDQNQCDCCGDTFFGVVLQRHGSDSLCDDCLQIATNPGDDVDDYRAPWAGYSL